MVTIVPTTARTDEIARKREMERWEGQAAYDIGVFLNRYLKQHPSPERSSFSTDLEEAGERLEGAGLRELADLGQRRLRVVGAGA